MQDVSRPRPRPDLVSRKMLAVVIALFAVIVVPVAAVTLRTCTVVVTVVNVETDAVAVCEVGVDDSRYGYNIVEVEPGEEHEWTYSLKPGAYEVHIYFWWQDQNYSFRAVYEDIDLTPFETKKIELGLEKWY